MNSLELTAVFDNVVLYASLFLKNFIKIIDFCSAPCIDKSTRKKVNAAEIKLKNCIEL